MKPTKPTFHGFLCKFDALVYDRKMQTLQRYCQRSTLINRLTSKGKFGMCRSLICMCATSLHCVFCCSLEEKRLLEFFSFMFAHHDTLNCDRRRQQKQHQTYVCVLLPSTNLLVDFFPSSIFLVLFFFCQAVRFFASCLLFRFHRYLWQLFLFFHIVCINRTTNTKSFGV